MNILQEPVRGNGLISLAHQLIGAKLNVAGYNGLDPIPQEVLDAIDDADAMIGRLIVPPVPAPDGYAWGDFAPSEVSALVDILTDFNEGTIGPGHCTDEVEPE